jgi:hypothetical protein
MSATVSVKATFTLPDGTVTTQKFDSSNTPAARLGLPAGEEVPPPPTSGSRSYSGRHDQGLLPPPQEGGAYSQLIGCVEATKKGSDMYLTEVMKQEKSRKQEPGEGSKPPKKTKIEL